MLIRYLLENNNKYKIPNDKEYDNRPEIDP